MALAAELGITTRLLQTYENDGAPPSRSGDLATALGVAPQFFTRPEPTSITVDHGFFRALRRATAGQLAAARAAASIGVEVYDWIASRFTLPEVGVPDLDQHDPEVAAAALRAVWGRGEEPLPNLVQLSEAHGVRVISLPTDADSIDAFSLWLDGVPYAFLSTAKSAERSRFDLAHELGHLVMHSRVPPAGDAAGSVGRQLEKEADHFASALLMPRPALLAHVGREPALPQILQVRDHYRVSAMAATKRLHDVGRLTDWGYRQNCVQLTQRGFRSGEPGGMARERSRVFGAVFSWMRQRGVTSSQVSHELGITPQELHGLTFGQMAVPLTGDGLGTQPSVAALRVVGGA